MTRKVAILHMILRREELKHSVGDLDEDIKAFDMAIQALEQTRWIPVSERLPEENNCTGRGIQFSDDVLMSVLNIVDEEDFIDFGHTIDGEWYSIVEKKRIQNGFDVIAWMPLPQSYVPDTNDGKMGESEE